MKMLEKKEEVQTQIVKDYINELFIHVQENNPHEKEFQQAVKEVLDSLVPVLEKNPNYIKSAVLDRMLEPDRMISFKVPWMNDNGDIKVNRGYRV